MLRRFVTVLLATLFLTGCASPKAPAPSDVVPRGKEISAEESADVREKARFKTTLNAMPLYLYAADEESYVEEADWCGGSAGQTGYRGHYTWYLEPGKGKNLLEQPAELTGPDGPLVFGGGREMVSELTLNQRKYIVVTQYMSCTLQAFQVYGLDEENTLKRFPFQFADGTVTERPGTSAGVEVKGSHLQTGFYDRAKTYGGGWIMRTWELKDGAFVEVKTEKRDQ